jgi:prevent-host-death family protein
MKSVGLYEAKTHLPRLLTQVEKGETITITKRGKPVAILSPAQRLPQRDLRTVIAEFRAYGQQHARIRGPVSLCELREMTEEGRP